MREDTCWICGLVKHADDFCLRCSEIADEPVCLDCCVCDEAETKNETKEIVDASN